MATQALSESERGQIASGDAHSDRELREANRALVILYLLTCIRVLNEYERGVIFRLGRAMPKPKGPGLIMVFWPVDSMMSVNLRTIT